MLNLKNVNKISINSNKQKVNTLTNVFVEIRQGDFICIQGVNGSGKSSLLSIIGAEDMSFEGEYFIDGIEISKYTSRQLQELRCSRFGIIPEGIDLLEKRTIEQNMELPLRIAKLSKNARKSAIIKALNSVGLSEKILQLKPTDLSIGQCQRVMAARAIVSNPQVIIADNPTALMDDESSELILNLFTALNKGGVTIVVVTRDENFLRRAKRVFTMSRGMLVENLKITRGKNVGEVIDIDAKKKKASKTSIKKQVIASGKRVKEEQSVSEEDKKEDVQVSAVVEDEKAPALKEDGKEEVKTETKKPEESTEQKAVKNATRLKTAKKKNESDDNQVTFDEIVGLAVPKEEQKKQADTKVKEPKSGKETKTAKPAGRSKETSTAKTASTAKESKPKSAPAKKKSDVKPEVREENEDSELLIKPVKSNRRKSN